MNEALSREVAEHLKGAALKRLRKLKGTPEIKHRLVDAIAQTDAAQRMRLMLNQLIDDKAIQGTDDLMGTFTGERMIQELEGDDEDMKLNVIMALIDEEIERLRASHEIELDHGGVWDFVREPGG